VSKEIKALIFLSLTHCCPGRSHHSPAPLPAPNYAAVPRYLIHETVIIRRFWQGS